jgi:hypothetical protein
MKFSHPAFGSLFCGDAPIDSWNDKVANKNDDGADKQHEHGCLHPEGLGRDRRVGGIKKHCHSVFSFVAGPRLVFRSTVSKSTFDRFS